MNQTDLQKLLDDHQKWLRGEDGGSCADLTDADLTGADLTGADLTRADLTGADLTRAVLTDADLTRAVLTDADLTRANLTDAVLTDAVLTRANLTDAVLTRANLTDAVLRGAYLRGANLTDAVLSNSKGLKTAKDYLSQFERTKNGIYVYKTFGAYKSPPDYWKIEPKSFIEEVVNPDHCTECGSGINFATLDWIKNDDSASKLPIWKCLIHWEDMADVVVPFNTDGKARCARLQLIEVVK